MLRPLPRRLFVLSVVWLLGGDAVGTTPAGAPRAERSGAARPPVPLPAGVERVAYERYVQDLDATFRAGPTEGGTAWIGIRSAGLVVDKRVSATGVMTMRLEYGSDAVTFEISARAIRVERGSRSVHLTPEGAPGPDADSLRRLLVGSKAVAAFRALTAALERREADDGAITVSAMIDGAFVAALDGDQAAVERIGRRVTRRARARARQAALGTAQFSDCVTDYERAILDAYRILGACYSQPSWYYYLLNYPFCSFEYLLRAEQYIFQFVSCVAIP